MSDEQSKSIVHSDVFRALNLLIDQKAAVLVTELTFLKRQCDYIFHPQTEKTVLDLRVSYEPEQNTETLNADISEIERLPDIVESIYRLEREINELQRFKLKLLNDYDFTHGDDSIQRIVFGGENE